LGLKASGGLELEHRARTESRIDRGTHAWAPCWLRLLRQGGVITAYQSTDGTNSISARSHALCQPEGGYVGLGVTSFKHAAFSTSLFDQVSVASLAPAALAR